MSGSTALASRKWQVTINNPLEKGFTHENIIEIMSGVRGRSLYWCMCDEEGDECETLHTHIFIYRRGAFTWQQINNLFPDCHRENCYGTPAENRAYVLKDGDKFNKQADGHYSYVDSNGKLHEGFNFSDTFYESGECPEEHQGKSGASDLIVGMIKDGATNDEIIDEVSSAYKDLEKIERVRSMYRDKKFQSMWRDLEVTYVFGRTGSGKTRGVMEKYGYQNCYRVTNYKHPFDSYDGQDVLIFEEFRGGIKHGDMLIYLDGYPLKLPCRFFDRQACYTKVYILSNIPPDEQYQNIDKDSRAALWRRIHTVIEYQGCGKIATYDGVEDYIHRYDWTGDRAEPYEQLPM